MINTFSLFSFHRFASLRVHSFFVQSIVLVLIQFLFVRKRFGTFFHFFCSILPFSILFKFCLFQALFCLKLHLENQLLQNIYKCPRIGDNWYAVWFTQKRITTSKMTQCLMSE